MGNVTQCEKTMQGWFYSEPKLRKAAEGCSSALGLGGSGGNGEGQAGLRRFFKGKYD